MSAEPPQQAAPAGERRGPARTQAMVRVFYLVDGVLLAAFALCGALPMVAALAFVVAGWLLVALFAEMARRGVHRRLGREWFTTLQLTSACGLMLLTAALLPQVGLLFMMTMIVAVATAALQSPLRHVLVVSALTALCWLVLLWLEGPRFGLPLSDPTLRLLTGLWFAVVLAKIAAINLIGTEMREALAASNFRLALALTQVRELSERDELTGLQNRRSILAQLSDERARLARGGAAFGLAILDIDHFKQVNDRLGHGMGDEVLKTFAAILTRHLRSTDRVARYGGEEFLLLMPNTAEDRLAALAAERFRQAVASHPWAELAPELQLTCSIGLTTSRMGETTAEMLERADAALYRAKSEGRNRVQVG